MGGLDYREELARAFQPRRRRYPSPLAMAMAVDRKTRTSPALEVIDRALVELVDEDEHDALAVYMPPQEGKSQLCARRLPEWVLDDDNSVPVSVVSYEQDMALRWGRDIKNDISHHPCRRRIASGERCEDSCGGLHIPIRRDSHAAGRWDTPDGGGVYCVGVGGPLTGRNVGLLIVDDPVKDRAAAESKTIRDSTWDWWESVALTRLANSKVVLIQTRWHEDDLAGRIMARPSPLRWRVLRIPAIADSPDDPLGRRPGEELPSVRGRRPGYFRNLKANMSSYVFSGIYGQKPVAPEGNFFRRASFRYWRPIDPWADGRERIRCEGTDVTLADCWMFITMDFAASTATTADFTVASLWCVTPAGDLILLDRRRGRVPDHEHFKLAEPLIARYPGAVVYVEKNWWSKTFVQAAVDAGVPVAPLTADTDKVTRAVPAAGLIHAGRVWFPAEASGCECGCLDGKWLDEYCDELAIFPSGSNDDQVDTTSYAVRVKLHEWTPAKAPTLPGLSAFELSLSAAYSSATGNGHGELDIMNVPY